VRIAAAMAFGLLAVLPFTLVSREMGMVAATCVKAAGLLMSVYLCLEPKLASAACATTDALANRGASE